jgi:predicted RNA-binding Zn-ribbon protein involved in translation (DUF1610 family)
MDKQIISLGDTWLREVGTCAGCGLTGNWLKDEVALWCPDCGGAGVLSQDQAPGHR